MRYSIVEIQQCNQTVRNNPFFFKAGTKGKLYTAFTYADNCVLFRSNFVQCASSQIYFPQADIATAVWSDRSTNIHTFQKERTQHVGVLSLESVVHRQLSSGQSEATTGHKEVGVHHTQLLTKFLLVDLQSKNTNRECETLMLLPLVCGTKTFM